MTEPGWYPDPASPGSLRWFDGSGWTDHVSEQPAPAPALSGPEPAAPPSFAPPFGFGATSPGPAPMFSAPAGGAQLADFGTRLGAYLIDVLIVVVPYWIAYNVAFRMSISLGFVVLLGGVALIAWYFATHEGGPTGQTIGKRQLGIAVVDAQTLQPGVGAGRAVGRYFGRLIDIVLCGLPIGYLWMLWDDDKQTWHDKIASTKVVKL